MADIIYSNAEQVQTVLLTKNYNDNLKRVMFCQAMLESNYGQSAIAKSFDWNWFGLNWYANDPYIICKSHSKSSTTQWYNGQYYNTVEEFCIFESMSQAVDCLYRWYDRPYYAGVKDPTKSVDEIIDIISKHYATSPTYASSLKDIYRRFCAGESGMDKLLFNLTKSEPTNKTVKQIILNFDEKGIYKDTQVIYND